MPAHTQSITPLHTRTHSTGAVLHTRLKQADPKTAFAFTQGCPPACQSTEHIMHRALSPGMAEGKALGSRGPRTLKGKIVFLVHASSLSLLARLPLRPCVPHRTHEDCVLGGLPTEPAG
eukprot:scaffold55321_cov22-Tisochrysis_lutea.AAC.2